MRNLIVLAAVCAIPTALLAQTDSKPAAATAAPEEKPVCRYYRATGSIMPGKRVCHSKDEWRQIDAQMSEAARHTLNQDRAGAGFGGSSAGGGGGSI